MKDLSLTYNTLPCFSVTGHIVDVVEKTIYDGTVWVEKGKIKSVDRHADVPEEAAYIMPGFIDAHVHTESTMVRPSEWAKAVVKLGTIAAATDPHEIANVLGVDGIKYLLSDARKVNFHFLFGASPCVPCTPYETSGAVLDAEVVGQLLQLEQIGFISELMNAPAVIHHDADTWKKIRAAQAVGKPIDGHAPGLTGDDLKAYVAAGISTDHECESVEEAIVKARLGMKILIREGSAARNFDALKVLIRDIPEDCMLCIDDMNPHDLLQGEINVLVQRAIAEGCDLWDVLRVACVNPRDHYHFKSGLLQPGDGADFIMVDNLRSFQVRATFINGQKVYDAQDADVSPVIDHAKENHFPNRFEALPISLDDIRLEAKSDRMKVIGAFDGQLYTSTEYATPRVVDGHVVSDTEQDVLKVIAYNRYRPGAQPVVAFMKGFGLKHAAMASSVAHDSHNLIAIGTSDALIVEVMNRLIEMQGGQLIISDCGTTEVSLPIAGLMSSLSVEQLAPQLLSLRKAAQSAGCSFQDPFMTLAFMALPVISTIKLSDQGLFDVDAFAFTHLFE